MPARIRVDPPQSRARSEDLSAEREWGDVTGREGKPAAGASSGSRLLCAVGVIPRRPFKTGADAVQNSPPERQQKINTYVTLLSPCSGRGPCTSELHLPRAWWPLSLRKNLGQSAKKTLHVTRNHGWAEGHRGARLTWAVAVAS